MSWYKKALEESEENIYQIEEGVLYDSEGDEVFGMKALLRLFPAMQSLKLKEIPKFRDATAANKFLEALEAVAGEKLGRVPDVNYLKELRYKDTNKEKGEAAREEIEKRNKQWDKGDFVNWPAQVDLPADILSPLA